MAVVILCLISALSLLFMIPSTEARGVLTIRLTGFRNPQGRTYDGACCDANPGDRNDVCTDQCDYVMRLIVSGLGRANDHVFLFHRPLKYDSNDIVFEQRDSNLVLTVLFDKWPQDGHVKMNAFFYDYDDYDHTTTLVDWFETDLQHTNSPVLSSRNGGGLVGVFQEQTVVGNRQSDKTQLTFEWSTICHEHDQCRKELSYDKILSSLGERPALKPHDSWGNGDVSYVDYGAYGQGNSLSSSADNYLDYLYPAKENDVAPHKANNFTLPSQTPYPVRQYGDDHLLAEERAVAEELFLKKHKKRKNSNQGSGFMQPSPFHKLKTNYLDLQQSHRQVEIDAYRSSLTKNNKFLLPSLSKSHSQRHKWLKRRKTKSGKSKSPFEPYKTTMGIEYTDYMWETSSPDYAHISDDYSQMWTQIPDLSSEKLTTIRDQSDSLPIFAPYSLTQDLNKKRRDEKTNDYDEEQNPLNPAWDSLQTFDTGSPSSKTFDQAYNFDNVIITDQEDATEKNMFHKNVEHNQDRESDRDEDRVGKEVSYIQPTTNSVPYKKNELEIQPAQLIKSLKLRPKLSQAGKNKIKYMGRSFARNRKQLKHPGLPLGDANFNAPASANKWNGNIDEIYETGVTPISVFTPKSDDQTKVTGRWWSIFTDGPADNIVPSWSFKPSAPLTSTPAPTGSENTYHATTPATVPDTTYNTKDNTDGYMVNMASYENPQSNGLLNEEYFETDGPQFYSDRPSPVDNNYKVHKSTHAPSELTPLNRGIQDFEGGYTVTHKDEQSVGYTQGKRFPKGQSLISHMKHDNNVLNGKNKQTRKEFAIDYTSEPDHIGIWTIGDDNSASTSGEDYPQLEHASGKQNPDNHRLKPTARVRHHTSNMELLRHSIKTLKSVQFQTVAPVEWYVTAHPAYREKWSDRRSKSKGKSSRKESETSALSKMKLSKLSSIISRTTDSTHEAPRGRDLEVTTFRPTSTPNWHQEGFSHTELDWDMGQENDVDKDMFYSTPATVTYVHNRPYMNEIENRYSTNEGSNTNRIWQNDFKDTLSTKRVSQYSSDVSKAPSDGDYKSESTNELRKYNQMSEATRRFQVDEKLQRALPHQHEVYSPERDTQFHETWTVAPTTDKSEQRDGIPSAFVPFGNDDVKLIDATRPKTLNEDLAHNIHTTSHTTEGVNVKTLDQFGDYTKSSVSPPEIVLEGDVENKRLTDENVHADLFFGSFMNFYDENAKDTTTTSTTTNGQDNSFDLLPLGVLQKSWYDEAYEESSVNGKDDATSDKTVDREEDTAPQMVEKAEQTLNEIDRFVESEVFDTPRTTLRYTDTSPLSSTTTPKSWDTGTASNYAEFETDSVLSDPYRAHLEPHSDNEQQRELVYPTQSAHTEQVDVSSSSATDSGSAELSTSNLYSRPEFGDVTSTQQPLFRTETSTSSFLGNNWFIFSSQDEEEGKESKTYLDTTVTHFEKENRGEERLGSDTFRSNMAPSSTSASVLTSTELHSNPETGTTFTYKLETSPVSHENGDFEKEPQEASGDFWPYKNLWSEVSNTEEVSKKIDSGVSYSENSVVDKTDQYEENYGINSLASFDKYIPDEVVDKTDQYEENYGTHSLASFDKYIPDEVISSVDNRNPVPHEPIKHPESTTSISTMSHRSSSSKYDESHDQRTRMDHTSTSPTSTNGADTDHSSSLSDMISSATNANQGLQIELVEDIIWRSNPDISLTTRSSPTTPQTSPKPFEDSTKTSEYTASLTPTTPQTEYIIDTNFMENIDAVEDNLLNSGTELPEYESPSGSVDPFDLMTVFMAGNVFPKPEGKQNDTLQGSVSDKDIGGDSAESQTVSGRESSTTQSTVSISSGITDAAVDVSSGRSETSLGHLVSTTEVPTPSTHSSTMASTMSVDTFSTTAQPATTSTSPDTMSKNPNEKLSTINSTNSKASLAPSSTDTSTSATVTERLVSFSSPQTPDSGATTAPSATAGWSTTPLQLSTTSKDSPFTMNNPGFLNGFLENAALSKSEVKDEVKDEPTGLSRDFSKILQDLSLYKEETKAPKQNIPWAGFASQFRMTTPRHFQKNTKQLPEGGFVLHTLPSQRQVSVSTGKPYLYSFRPPVVNSSRRNRAWTLRRELDLKKFHSFIKDIRYGPTVNVPSLGLFTPHADGSYGNVTRLPDGTALGESSPGMSAHLKSSVNVANVFTRYWPAVLGVTVGTIFLITALVTSIWCRQRRLLVQRARWADSPQHVSEPPDTSEYATSSAASLTSDLTRSSINLV